MKIDPKSAAIGASLVGGVILVYKGVKHFFFNDAKKKDTKKEKTEEKAA